MDEYVKKNLVEPTNVWYHPWAINVLSSPTHKLAKKMLKFTMIRYILEKQLKEFKFLLKPRVIFNLWIGTLTDKLNIL